MPLSRRVLGCLLLLVACEDDAVDSSDAGPMSMEDAAPDPTPDAGEMPFDSGVASELDCPGVFDCVATCGEDEPCVDACIARGSEAALVLVEGVATCAEQLGCADEDCLAENCGPELLACAGTPVVDGDDGGIGDSDAGGGCEGAGRPEMTGPISGLQAAYAGGDMIEVGVPVDEDTMRVIVGIYEVGSQLYLGGTAEDVTPSSTATLNFYAGVAGGETGSFYLSVELCSTSVCTTPFVRNTYQRADRTAPLASGETYVQTRENVGGPPLTESCPSSIPIQSFQIN